MSEIAKHFGHVLAGVRYVERPGAYAFLHNSARELAVVKTPHGLFLPGGGLDENEPVLDGLRREIREEIGYELDSARFVVRAAQYHWSEFYRSHFKKIGSFFEVQAAPPQVPVFEKDHTLLWLVPVEAERVLSQEFQRWATAQYWRGLA